MPPNWEDQASLAAKGISTQVFIKEFQQGVWGGIADDPSQDTATIEQYPNRNPLVDLSYGVVKMPYNSSGILHLRSRADRRPLCGLLRRFARSWMHYERAQLFTCNVRNRSAQVGSGAT
ncbi:MAG: hypothetical protein M3Y72_19825 [Acidobacteriota bacterium]|nr:hypothetical protein [Acidobacteriota bacterium]